MKKTMKYFSMAALALVGAVMTSCSSDDLTEDNQQFAENNGNNVETLTASISMAGGETRALTSGGVKTFAEGDKIAVVYKNTSGETVKAESEELEAGDITNEGKSANFTVTLTNADKTKNVTYIYPAAMAGEGGSIASISEQDGTLESLASNMDYCKFSGAWDGSDLPTGEMDNQLVICAFTLKDCLGTSDITSTITNMTVSDGTNTYNVTRDAAPGPIYVAIYPTSSNNINYTATSSTKFYAKYVTSKTYAAGSWHNIGLKMAEVVKGKFTVDKSGNKVFFSKGNLRATYISSVWSWSFAPNQWSIIGNNSANINITGNGTVSVGGAPVDLFGWSTSTTHLGIHNSTNNNVYRGEEFADWGSASEVTAYIGTGWRSLNGGEWDYLLKDRTTTSGKHYCKAKVDGHFGVILLPDDWNTSYYNLQNCDVVNLAFSDGALVGNIISLEVWNASFVPHGAVFLPTTGQREGATVTNENGRLYYWSSTSGANTSGESANANQMYIAGNAVSPNTGAGRHFGNAVRLVYPIK